MEFVTIKTPQLNTKYPKQLPTLGKPLWHQKQYYGYKWATIKGKAGQITWQTYNAYIFDQLIANLYNQRYQLKYGEMKYGHIKRDINVNDLQPYPNGECIGCQASEDNYGGQINELAFISYDHPKIAIIVHRNGKIETSNLKRLQIQYLWPLIMFQT